MIVSSSPAANKANNSGASVSLPDAATEMADTVTTSVTSRSSTLNEPSVDNASSPSSNVSATSVAAVTVGASLEPLIVIVKVSVSLVSSPPFSVPPPSFKNTVTVTTADSSAARAPVTLLSNSNVKLPSRSIAGVVEKNISSPLSIDTSNSAVSV